MDGNLKTVPVDEWYGKFIAKLEDAIRNEYGDQNLRIDIYMDLLKDGETSWNMFVSSGNMHVSTGNIHGGKNT
jgi:hypothetical protein